MADEGFDPAECLDYDFAVVDFYSWVEARQDEKIPVRESSKDKLPNGGKGWTWGSRHESMQGIFDLFNGVESDDKRERSFDSDPDVDAIDIDEMMLDFAREDQGDDGDDTDN